MGLPSAAFICQRVTKAVRHMCEERGCLLTNYLNDFAGCATWDMAKHDFETVDDILKNCGLAESIDKACPPSTEMVFLGVLFDTNKLTLEITSD